MGVNSTKLGIVWLNRLAANKLKGNAKAVTG